MMIRTDLEEAPMPVSKDDTNQITRDDRTLVEMFLTPNKGSLIDQATGNIPSNSVQWTAYQRATAQDGMVLLVQLQLAETGIELRENTVRGARAAIAKLHPKNSARILPKQEIFKGDRARKILHERGRDISYQNLGARTLYSSYFDLKTCDWLHFGRNLSPSTDETPLSTERRIYVGVEPHLAAHLACEVIEICRRYGFDPYGKVFDQSTLTDSVLSGRFDYLLFIPRSEETQQILGHAISQVYKEHPEWFRAESPFLTKETRIPGVSVADQPTTRDVDGSRESYHTNRVRLLHEAWDKTLAEFVGPPEGKTLVGQILVDNRVLKILGALGPQSYNRDVTYNRDVILEKLVGLLRNHVQELSPAYGVSTTDFTKTYSPVASSLSAAHRPQVTAVPPQQQPGHRPSAARTPRAGHPQSLS